MAGLTVASANDFIGEPLLLFWANMSVEGESVETVADSATDDLIVAEVNWCSYLGRRRKCWWWWSCYCVADTAIFDITFAVDRIALHKNLMSTRKFKGLEYPIPKSVGVGWKRVCEPAETNKRTNKQEHNQTTNQTKHEKTNKQTNKQTNQANGRAIKQTSKHHKQTDKLTSKQANTETNVQAHKANTRAKHNEPRKQVVEQAHGRQSEQTNEEN